MKCKDCNSCKLGWFKSKPEAYVCIGVKEPFVIMNINNECTEYPEKNDCCMTATTRNGVYIFGKQKPDADKQPKADAKRIAEAVERTKKYMNIQIGSQNVIKGSNIIRGTSIIDGKVIVDGVELPPPPTKCHNTTIINNKVYIDGYEFKNGKWKKTLKAWWHLWF